MKDGKKTKSILKGASFFLATFAFVGMLAMGTRFVKHKDYNNAGSQIVAVAAVGDTASIEYKYKVGDGAYNVVGEFVGEAETVHTFGQTTNLVDGKVAGYYFRGWYDNADCTGDALTTLDSSLEGNQGDTITLYAKLEVATTRTLTAQTVEHGTYHLSSTTGRYGEVITLVADTADENYEIKGGYYTDTEGNNRVDFEKTTFECPDFDALVYATFGEHQFNVSIGCLDDNYYDCSFMISADSAQEGDEITINIYLAEGYGVRALGYMSDDEDGNDIFVPITQQGENENEYVFTMPAQDVGVLVQFGETFDANWTQFKFNHSSEIVNNVTTFVSATNMQNEEGDTYIDTNVYARISGDTLYLFSTNSNKVVLPSGCNAFFVDPISHAPFENLESIYLDNLDTSRVEDMSYMFLGCEGITNLDLSGFDTSSLVKMEGMFQGCSSLTNIVYGENFDTSNVTHVDFLFSGCDALTTLDLSSYDFSSVRPSIYVDGSESKIAGSLESTASKIIMPKALPTTYYDAECNYSEDAKTYDIVFNIKVDDAETANCNATYSYKLQNNNFATTGTLLTDFPVSTAGTKQVIYRADMLHNVTVDSTIQNGTVTVDYAKYVENETVTINATPASGYDVEAYYYYEVGFPENKMSVENATFSMPNYDVVVGAEFTVPSAIIYKNEGGADFVGNFDGNYPTTHTNLAKELKVPTRAGYHFAGWYLDQACTENSLASQEWDSELGVNVTKYYLPANQVGDTTVYAKWAPTLNMTLWEAFKEDYATALANVERVTTLVNQEVQTGDSQLGENIYARIYDNAGTQTLVLYSTTDKIYLYDDSKQFFADAFSNVVSMDLTKFDTTYVTDISEMFNGCSALTSLDLSSFVLNDGVVVSDVFTGCNTLQTIYTPQRYPLLTGDDHIDLPGYWTGDGFGGHTNYMEYFPTSTTENRQEISRVVLFEVNVDPNQGFGTINWAEGSVLNMVAKNAAVTVEGANVLVDGQVVATANGEEYGYTTTFTGWAGLDTIGTDSISLVANFTRVANQHTVTFDTNGGTLNEESRQVVFGENYGVLPTPTREGYVFDGWYVRIEEDWIGRYEFSDELKAWAVENGVDLSSYSPEIMWPTKRLVPDNQTYLFDADATLVASWTKEGWLSDHKWEMFKIQNAQQFVGEDLDAIISYHVKKVKTATNMASTEGDYELGGGNYARIDGDTLWIFSTTASKIMLPEDTSFFFNLYAQSWFDEKPHTSGGFNYIFGGIEEFDLSAFDTSNVKDMSFMFAGALMGATAEHSNIDVSGFNTANVTNMTGMFLGYLGDTLNLTNFDTHNVTNMKYMFASASKLTSLDLSDFDTANVTDMSMMFQQCNKLTSLDLSGFNTANVTDMQGMFNDCSSLENLNVTSFNTTNVTNMGGMFAGCTALESIDVTGFNTEKVTDAGEMFSGCSWLRNIDLSSFDLSKLTEEGAYVQHFHIGVNYDGHYFDMFKDCDMLMYIVLPKAICDRINNPEEFVEGGEYWYFNLPGTFALASDNYTTRGTSMWDFAENLSTAQEKQTIAKVVPITIQSNNQEYGTVDVEEFTYYGDQTVEFEGNTIKVNGVVAATATPKTSQTEGVLYVFDEWEGEGYDIVAAFSQINGYTISYNLNGGTATNPTYYTAQNTPITLNNPTKEGYTFTGWTYEGQTTPVETVTITSEMTGDKVYTANFEQVATTLDKTLWEDYKETYKNDILNNVRTITTATNMVAQEGDVSVGNGVYVRIFGETLTIFSINDSKIILPADCSLFFYKYAYTTINDEWIYSYFQKITTIDLSNLDTTNVTDMSLMFTYCRSLTSLDVSGFNTSNVTSMAAMFNNCSSLTNLDVSGFNTTNVTNVSDMFSFCEALTSLDLSNFDMSDVTNVGGMLNSCNNLTTIYTPKALPSDTTLTIDLSGVTDGGTATYGLANNNYQTTGTTLNAFPVSTVGNKQQIVRQKAATAYVNNNSYGTVTTNFVYYAGQTITEDGNTLKVGDTVIATATPATIEGYTVEFDSWDLTALESNDIVTANFTSTINEYTITFVVDGENYQVITKNYGTTVTPPADPTKEGYTFTGWSEAVPETMPAENKTITANFEINQYTITFVVDGENYQVITQNYGTEVIAPTDPTKTGYTFTGWSEAVPETMPAENITINATWTANEYTLTIKENDTYGAVIATITQGYGTTIDYSGVDTTKYGYTFGGYSDQPQTMPLDGGEIYAYFTANGHTLYFNANGGYVDLQSTEVTYGQEYGALPIPTRDGYTFLGWYDTNGFLKADDEVYNLDGDTTFTAYWQTITYKIILIINNEVASQIPYTIESSDYTLADAQEPTGYSFLGWTGDGNTTPRKGVIIRSGSMGDKVFTAKFEANRYDIEYRDYGTPGGFSGTTDGLPTFHIYDQATTLVESTRTGYKFVGWMLNGEMITRIAENTVAGNITLDAVWEANSYDIVYRDKNNTTFSGLFAGEYPEKYTYDRNTTLVSPTRVGYDFVGWFSDAACTQPITQIPAGYDTQAVTVYADWTAQQYTITYCERYGAEFGGTTAGLPTTHTYDQTTVLGTTTKEGYTFAGWYTDEDCQNQVNQIGAFTKTENFYLYAKFDANKYDIVYKDQNGEDYTGATEGLPTQFVYDEQTYLPTPTRAGYDFVGWFLDQECEYQQITEIPSKYASQAVTVYAKWNEATFTVYFNTNGGYMPSGNGSMNATYLSAYGDIETPEKEYYDFAGWYSDAALTNAVNADTIYNFTQDSNLYAKWTPTVYTITLHIFNNDQTVEFTVESDSFTLARPQVEGYTFVEWLRDGSSVGADYNPTYNEAENYELTANFEAMEYTYKLQVNIELTDDQGNPVFDPEVYDVEHAYTIEDDDIALPNIDVSQYGVFFRGWTGEGLENPTTDVVIAKGSIGNRVYVAHFTGEPFTMTFDALGGEVSVESMEVRYQEEIGTLPQATKDGYTFAGWYRDQACTDGNEITADMLLTTKGNFTAYAKWKANAYKIRRNIDGVTFVTLYSPDDKAFNLPIPTKRGYKFVGWTGTDLEEMQRVVTIASGSIGDKEYVAHFELATYIITLQVNGETYDEIEYTMESRDIKIGEIEVDGYTFNGWTGEGITTPTKEIVVEMGSVGNKLYKANLTAHTYTATITIDGEEREIEFTPNSEDIVIQNPTKDGYVFLGWQAEGSTELVKNLVIKKGTVGDQAYTAVWEEAKPQEEKAGMNKTLVIGIAAGAGGLVLATGVTLGVLKLKKRRR